MMAWQWRRVRPPMKNSKHRATRGVSSRLPRLSCDEASIAIDLRDRRSFHRRPCGRLRSGAARCHRPTACGRKAGDRAAGSGFLQRAHPADALGELLPLPRPGFQDAEARRRPAAPRPPGGRLRPPRRRPAGHHQGQAGRVTDLQAHRLGRSGHGDAAAGEPQDAQAARKSRSSSAGSSRARNTSRTGPSCRSGKPSRPPPARTGPPIRSIVSSPRNSMPPA